VARRRRNTRYRRGRLTVLSRILSFVLICVAIVAALILFFKVESIEISGNERYSDEDVFVAAGIEYGENMFLINKYAVAGEITSQLPYVSSVQIRRGLPSTIRILVNEGEADAAVAHAGELWMIDTTGKLLERLPIASDSDTMVIRGCELLLPTEGSFLALPEDGNISGEGLLQLLEAIEKRGMSDRVEWIDCGDEEKLVLRYGGRFDVELPYETDFDKKLLALSEIEKRLEENERGTVILTLNDRSFFVPENT